MTAKGRRMGRRKGPATTRARMELDQRRAQLLELGHAAFATSSYDAVSIDDIARAAGVSKGLLYHYFPTKRHFYVAVLEQSGAELLARTDVEEGVPLVQRLETGLVAYFTYVSEHAGAYATLMRGGIGADPQVAEVVNRVRQTFVERILAAAVRASPAGAQVAENQLFRAVLWAWIGSVEAVSLHLIEEQRPADATLVDLLVKQFLFAADLATRPRAGP